MRRVNSIFLLLFFIFSCSDDMEPEQSTDPSDIEVTELVIVGAHKHNPYGDGNGVVYLWVKAKNSDQIKVLYNGVELERRRGAEFFFRADRPGIHEYELEIQAFNTSSNCSISKFVVVEVNRIFPIPEQLYSDVMVGDKKWRVNPESQMPVWVETAAGEFIMWIGKDSRYEAMYDDVYTFGEQSIMHQTNGQIVGKEGPLNEDFGEILDEINENGDYLNYPLESYSANWLHAGEGTFIMEDRGFIGSYVGGNHIYEIQRHSDFNLLVRTLGADGNYWYFSMTSE